jgi:hypothetical protein
MPRKTARSKKVGRGKTAKANPAAALKKERKAMAEDLYDAIRAGDHRKVDALGKKIDAENRTGAGGRVPVTTRGVNAAMQASPMNKKDLLRGSLRAIEHLHKA